MKIFIICCINHQKYEFEVYKTDTIESVKLKIQDSLGLQVRQQLLQTTYGKKLEDNRTLEDYGIKDENELLLIIRLLGGCDPKPIFIKHKDKITEIKVCFCKNIYDLKNIIRDKIGINSKCQELSLNGRVLNDHEILRSLGVKENTLFELKEDNTLEIKEKYKNELTLLKDMGYIDEKLNIQVLNQCDGNTQDAIEILLNMYN